MIHEKDDWVVLCGATHTDDPSEYLLVGLGHLLESDSTLLGAIDLPIGWEAERESWGAYWKKSPTAMLISE